MFDCEQNFQGTFLAGPGHAQKIQTCDQLKLLSVCRGDGLHREQETRGKNHRADGGGGHGQPECDGTH